MIRNTQTTMKVSDEKWERIFGKKDKTTNNQQEITITADLLFKISNALQYHKIHQELTLEEVCKLYDIDFKLVNTYFNTIENGDNKDDK